MSKIQYEGGEDALEMVNLKNTYQVGKDGTINKSRRQ